MEKDILYLLCQGKLPIAAVELALLPGYVSPAIKSIQWCFERGEQPPLSPKHVWKIAQVRYSAKEETELLLKSVAEMKPDKPLLESVCNSLVLKSALQKISKQLADGEYNIEEIRKLIDVNGVDARVRPVSLPEGKKEYPIKSGITRLDKAVGGFSNELIIVAARPKQGKSNFFANVIAKSPGTRILYITVADYDYNDFMWVLAQLNTAICQRDNLFVSDLTGFSASIVDVEAAIRDSKPQLVIVDRAEKLTPLRKRKDIRLEVGEIFDTLRRIAKKYEITVFTDSQISAEGEYHTLHNQKRVSYSSMAEDRTNRAAVMDLFIGLHREGRATFLTVVGRRPGLPVLIEQPTDAIGRYYE